MNPGRIDLHVHTTASDGTLTPAETVRDAVARGVALLAITDHDCTDGIAEALDAAKELEITLVPGCELSVGSDETEVHLLAYFMDISDAAFQEALAKLRGARDVRNERILARLRELGAPLDITRLRQIAGDGSVGRPHIAKALVEARHVSSEGAAFGRYLARGKPAYVGRERLGPAEASNLIRDTGGIPVLAHPAKIGPRPAIEGIIDQGIAGVEVFHSDHDAKDVELLMKIARERGLLITGGTDSHGPHSSRPRLIGSVNIPEWVGEELLARAPRSWREQR